MSAPALATLAQQARIAKLVGACEARVVRRQWASWDIWSPEPLYFERNQYSRGRKLAKQPARKHDAKLYGYAADGRVARVQSWSGFLGKWNEEELYVPVGDRVVVSYRFRVDGTLMNVHRYTSDADGRLVLHEVFFGEAKRVARQKFVWRDGLLERVDVTSWGHSWKLDWDDIGQLQKIFGVSSGKSHEIYRRPATGETLPALLELIRDRLIEVIPAVFAKEKPKSKAYALALVVDEEEWRYMLPPLLACGFEADRAEIHATRPQYMLDKLWSAAEIYGSPTLELRDRRLAAAAKRANQQIWSAGAQGKVTPMLREVARALQAIDWKSRRAVTDDFVVYVTALEGEGPRHVRRDAPPALRKQLKARGYL